MDRLQRIYKLHQEIFSRCSECLASARMACDSSLATHDPECAQMGGVVVGRTCTYALGLQPLMATTHPLRV